MASEADAKIVRAQESALVFDQFDEDTAYAIGKAIRDTAAKNGQAIVVEIRLWNRPLFYTAMKGTSPDNVEWVRRKYNTVRRFNRATYGLVSEGQTENFGFPAFRGMEASEYVGAGGGFPILVKGAGPVGAIIVSGLSDRDDHNVIVAAVCSHLGKDAGPLTLPAPN